MLLPRKNGFKLRQRPRLGVLNQAASVNVLLNVKRPAFFRISSGARPRLSPSIWLGSGDIHRYRKYTNRIAPIRLLCFPNAHLFGHGLILDESGAVLSRHEYSADEVLDIANPVNLATGAYRYDPNSHRVELSPCLQERHVAEPCLVVAQCGASVYGHWLLDILPKIALAAIIPTNIRIVLAEPIHPWQAEFLRLLGISDARVIGYDPRNERLSLDRAFLISQPRTVYAMNPMSNMTFNALVAAVEHDADVETPSVPLYVSRRSVAGNEQRLLNADQVESVMRDRGIRIVTPECLTVADQIRTFARASLVIGEQGSVMHNSAFSPSGVPVLSLHSEAAQYFAQAGLGSIRGQPTGFIFGRYVSAEDPYRTGRIFEIDLRMLRSALDSLRPSEPLT